jgi:hypothetical protein
MKHHGHPPHIKFGLKTYFNTQSQLKGRGHVLITKFDRARKTRLSGLVFWNIRFSQFLIMNREGAKCEDLKILVHLRHGKGIRSTKEPRQKKSKLEVEVAKTGLCGLGYQSIQFF